MEDINYMKQLYHKFINNGINSLTIDEKYKISDIVTKPYSDCLSGLIFNSMLKNDKDFIIEFKSYYEKYLNSTNQKK